MARLRIQTGRVTHRQAGRTNAGKILSVDEYELANTGGITGNK